ncbi:hypothetical protein IH970_07345 [candidate division KSB1 bacterium]|nr:hypothetical protein [candidate division KSB1 bacterium]
MGEIVIGLIGAILGGIIGTVLTFVLTRPKLSISISDTLVEPVQPDPSDKKALARKIFDRKAIDFLQVPDGVLQTFWNCDYVTKPDRFYQHPSQYTFELIEIMRDNEMVKLLHSGMPSLLKELKRTLHSDLMEDFFVAWHPFNHVLWGELLGAVRKGEFDLVIDEIKLGEVKNRMFQDDDGDYSVSHSRYVFYFRWTDKAKAEKEVVEPFAKKLALVFAHENKESLRQVINYLEKVNWEDPALEKVSKTVEEELRRFSKIIVRGVISNAGRTPVSIVGRGQLVIQSKGFEYQREKINEVKRIHDDIKIDVSVMKENLLETDLTLVIPGGSAVAFEAHSDFFTSQLPHFEEIHHLFGSERHVFVKFRRIDDRGIVKSAIKQFCEFKRDELFQ